jgi:hypothetical protein
MQQNQSITMFFGTEHRFLMPHDPPKAFPLSNGLQSLRNLHATWLHHEQSVMFADCSHLPGCKKFWLSRISNMT